MSSCVEWTRARDSAGYGQLWDPALRRVIYAHRRAYEVAHGPIPDGMVVMHSCDNPACVNVEHLELGTHRDNALDKQRKGRGNQPKGLKNGRCKFSDDVVQRMRALWQSGELSQTEIAKRFGASSSNVSRIVRGEYR